MFAAKRVTFVSIRHRLNASLRRSARRNVTLTLYLCRRLKFAVTFDVFGVMATVTVSNRAFVAPVCVTTAHQWEITQHREHN